MHNIVDSTYLIYYLHTHKKIFFVQKVVVNLQVLYYMQYT